MIELALAVFAVYRVAELIVIDDGPSDVFKRWRVWVGVYSLGEDGRPNTNAGRFFSCPYCVGIQIAFFVALIVAPFDWRLVLYWLGIAGTQAFLQTVGGRTP